MNFGKNWKTFEKESMKGDLLANLKLNAKLQLSQYGIDKSRKNKLTKQRTVSEICY